MRLAVTLLALALATVAMTAAGAATFPSNPVRARTYLGELAEANGLGRFEPLGEWPDNRRGGIFQHSMWVVERGVLREVELPPVVIGWFGPRELDIDDRRYELLAAARTWDDAGIEVLLAVARRDDPERGRSLGLVQLRSHAPGRWHLQVEPIGNRGPVERNATVSLKPGHEPVPARPAGTDRGVTPAAPPPPPPPVAPPPIPPPRIEIPAPPPPPVGG